MRPLRVTMLGAALLLLLGTAESASAAWNNVFQTTGLFRNHGCLSRLFGCCDPCPQTQCTTSYVQRCYYQPITTYQTRTYYQPVTTYRTSYYYEPVCSYRYSCYYDPCTCSYRQVAVPTTSYRLRSQCCPVQSWVQRCCSVPVTSYRRCCYWQPVTSCCSITNGAVATAPPVATSPPVAAEPPTTAVPPAVTTPPAVTEERTPGTNSTPPAQKNQDYNKYYPPPQPGTNSGAGQRTPEPQPLTNRIVSRSKTSSATAFRKSPNWVQGRVLRGNDEPFAGASLVFVNIDRRSNRVETTANETGRFGVSLSSGRWYVYLRDANGRENYHSRIDVNSADMPFLTLVSR